MMAPEGRGSTPYHLVLLEPGQRVWYTHISKCGVSFQREVGQHILRRAYGRSLSQSQFYVPMEMSPTWAQMKEGQFFGAVMLRNPRAHVVSLFNHCLHYPGQTWLTLRDDHLSRRSQPTPSFYDLVANGGLRKWLDHFLGSEQDDLGCYEPVNFQSRFLVNVVDSEAARLTHPPPHLVERALYATHFVGLLEHYGASLCLFAFQVTGKLPEDCADPCRQSKVKHLHESHGYNNSVLVDDLDAATLALIDNLTRVDSRLYVAAKHRFRRSANAAGVSLQPCG